MTSYEERITELAVAESSAQVLPAQTVLMAMYGATVGALGITSEPATCNQASCAMIADSNQCAPRWLFYALLHDRPRVISLASGAAQQNLSGKAIRDFTYSTPPLAEQHAIAEVLAALDDKIAANTKLADTAWELADAMFRRAALDGPEPTRLGNVLALEYGKSLPATARGAGSVAVAGSGGVVGTHVESLVSTSGVVVGRKGSAGAVHWVDGPHWPIDTTFYAVPIADGVSSIFSYFLLRTLGLDEMNGDSAVPGLNRAEALAVRTSLPSRNALDAFGFESAPLIAAAEQSANENRTLAATRDALLPQLMSGKLRVRALNDSLGSNEGKGT